MASKTKRLKCRDYFDKKYIDLALGDDLLCISTEQYGTRVQLFININDIDQLRSD